MQRKRYLFVLFLVAISLFVIIYFTSNDKPKGMIDNKPAIDTLTRKPTFSFIFDDNNVSDSAVVAKFKQYDFKCGFAIITSEYFTRQQEYLDYQDVGFEILSHSVDIIRFSDGKMSLKDADKKFESSLQQLKTWGFNVKGWVTPESAMQEKYIPFLEAYYIYGFTIYYGKPQTPPAAYHRPSDELRHLKRLSLEWENTDDMIMAEIDEAIKQNGLLFFYAHKYPDKLTESRLNTILDKLKILSDSNKCNVLPPYRAIQKYYWGE